jgi:hypothetical protein
MVVGNVGTEIKCNVGIDVTDATCTRLLVEKPSGTQVQWAATKQLTFLSYITQAGDLDEAGSWQLQAYIEHPDYPANVYSPIVRFTVDSRLFAATC